MLKRTFCACGLALLAGCGSAQPELANRPASYMGATSQTTQGTEVVIAYGPSGAQGYVLGCSQPNGGTGISADGVEVVYETPETAQALAASDITVTPTGIRGRNFRLDAVECQTVRTVRFIIRGSQMTQGGYHVRIIAANSDCTAELAIVQNGNVTNFLPSITTRACRVQGR